MFKVRPIARVFIALVMIICSSCSSYPGPYKPDFTLTGEAREQEIQKFSFKEGFFHQGVWQFAMGPQEKPYWISSLKPVITEVSPEAWKHVEEAHASHRYGQITFALALAILISELTDGDKEFSRDQALLYWPLLGVTLGSSLLSVRSMNRAAGQYNRDLRARFDPVVGWNFSF